MITNGRSINERKSKFKFNFKLETSILNTMFTDYQVLSAYIALFQTTTLNSQLQVKSNGFLHSRRSKKITGKYITYVKTEYTNEESGKIMN